MRKHILTSLISMLSIVPAHSVGTNAYISVSASDIPDGRKSVDTVSSDLPNIEVKSLKNKKRVSSSTPQYNLDSEIIRQTGITDISEAMRRLPGVNLRDYGGAGGLKTVSVRGLGSEHTAVIYDGVSLSDCQSGQIDLSRYSIDNVRSLSLYSGDNDDIFLPAKAAASASSLYISSFTSTDDADFHLKSQMKIGSFGYYNPYIRLGKGNDNDRGFSYSANAEYIHSENDYPFILTNGDLITHEKRENSRMNSWLGEFNGMYRFGDSSRIVGKVYYYDNSRDLPGQVIYYVNGSNEHLRDRNFFGQFQYKGRLSSKFSLASTAKFNWSSSRYTDIDGKYPGGILDNYYIQRETYFTGALLFTPFSGFSMDYSLDWSWNNLSSNLKTDIRPYRNSILQTLAAKYKVWRLTVMARALYSLYINKAKDGDAGKDNRRLSPSVMLSLKPIADVGWYIRTSYKNIFRVPTFNEAYFDHYGSINLDPEITDQFNFGMTFESNATFLSNITLTCDGYINHVKNKIVAVPYNMFVWRMTNLGKVRVFGLDATISSEYVVTDKQSLILTGSYSYQRAQPRTNPGSSEWMKQVAYIPLNSGSASLSWLNSWVNGVIHFTGCSPRYTTNSNISETKIDGYCDFGFSVSRTFMLKNKNKFRIQGDLLNVFNRQYEIVARYPMPGRSWKISVEFEM